MTGSLLALVAGASLTSLASAADCTPSNQADGCTYKFKHDMYPAEYGYYTVDGFTGYQPELTMTAGKTYTFDQTDGTNWMHPLGWAYQPDGAHSCAPDGCPEVEEAGALTYKIDGVEPKENVVYTYGSTKKATAVGDGLDGYEPEFFMPKDMWSERKYTVDVVITPEVEAKAAKQGGYIFYFCHIHSKMSGKIKIKGSTDIGTTKMPTLYAFETHKAFDTTCGTTDAAAYENDKQTFLCGAAPTDATLKSYSKCLHAVDAKMNDEMRVTMDTNADPAATFMHQMIPHHANAVNMAKTLLKHYKTQVEGDEDLNFIVNDIVHRQNHQITAMRTYIAAKVAGSTAGWKTEAQVECDEAQSDARGAPLAGAAALAAGCLAAGAAALH